MTLQPGGLNVETAVGGKSAQTAGSARSAKLRETVRNVLAQRSAVVGLILLGLLLFTAVFADDRTVRIDHPDAVWFVRGVTGVHPTAVERRQ